MGGVIPGVCRDNPADALKFKSLNLPADNTSQEAAMETGVSFIQRMQEDAEFRQKVNACANGVERLAFLKSEGYDFTPFIQILDKLSSSQQSTGGLEQPCEPPSHRQSAPGLWSRITQIFRTPKAPRTVSQPYGIRRGGPSDGASF
jgi:hypothetical protein